MSQKESVSRTIARKLLNMIETGHFPPGSKLPTEKELTAFFSVSRAPIREALSMLRAAGFINSRQGGGSYVEETTNSTFFQHMHVENDDVETIKHLFEMRKVLEPEAAYLAALRRTPEQLNKMKQILMIMEEESIGQGTSAMKADIDFHSSIIRATHNPIMIQTLESLSSLYEKALNITLRPNEQLTLKRKTVYHEHQSILLAIESEEPDLAKLQCQIHLRNAEKKLSLFLQDYSV
ncbi:GntR family transcriptional repressor for pyruvate dehydrogenase complex [Peribacillus deserti]|uniref:GntR family transcriptional repressor for pyruvate dehydrogenase complex n=1 Tax=Peribacillus deserti TaxID=673318 RepID=A0ABS2QEX1_9BACI|nr:FadR/GntR family transcriptional regulator [Peribacillus deserti]MBM7691689.1 GntR family transcriptional repressor for pyruvate dehydrogenase complex [Peribacillus deserti]